MSLDLVIDAINALIDDANRNERLGSWFADVDTYARKVLYTLHCKTFDLQSNLPGLVGARICLRRQLQQ